MAPSAWKPRVDGRSPSGRVPIKALNRSSQTGSITVPCLRPHDCSHPPGTTISGGRSITMNHKEKPNVDASDPRQTPSLETPWHGAGPQRAEDHAGYHGPELLRTLRAPGRSR